MKKVYLNIIFLFILINSLYSTARNIELVDVPTANTLIKGEVRCDVKFYPGGGILTKLYAGFFDRLIIGGSFNINNLIGTGEVTVDLPPKFFGKIRFTDDKGVIPAISLGYDGERYLDVEEKGLFVSLTKEINLANIFFQLTGVIYTNEFNNFGSKIDGSFGCAFALTREFIITGEYDSFFGDERAHINFGIGYFFDPIEIKIGVKYGLSDKDIRLARILKIGYVNYF